MKGFRVSQGKKKVVYVYENIITPEERRIVQEYYLPAGYIVEPRVKDIDTIKKNAKERGFISEASKADKKTLLAWIEEYYPEHLEKWEKKFDSKKNGGLGFAKAKAEFRKKYPNFPAL